MSHGNKESNYDPFSILFKIMIKTLFFLIFTTIDISLTTILIGFHGLINKSDLQQREEKMGEDWIAFLHRFNDRLHREVKSYYD